MDAETIRNIIYSLAGLFAFVTTIWAISLPAIREHSDGAYWLTRTAWTILGVIGFAVVGGAILSPDPKPEEVAALYLTLDYWVGLGMAIAYLLAGCGIVLTLSEVSQPRK